MVKIFADFNNCDDQGRVRLNTNGTLADLKINNVELSNGMRVIMDDGDELRVEGVVEYSEKEKIWVAVFNENDFQLVV